VKNIFGYCHPAVLLIYLGSAIACSMMTLQPVCVALSLCMASLYSIRLSGLRRWLSGLRLLAPLFLLIAIGNPVFNHRGATPMFFV